MIFGIFITILSGIRVFGFFTGNMILFFIGGAAGFVDNIVVI